MITVVEIEAAVDKLPSQQQERLLFFLTARLSNGGTVPLPTPTGAGRSVLEITPVRVGEVLQPFSTEDDLLGEMLEGRV